MAAVSPYDYDGIIARANAQLERDPNNVAALISKSFALGQKGASAFNPADYGTEAALAAELALTLNPENADAYRALGYAYELQRKFPEAHAAYKKSLQIDPVSALVSDAHVYELEGNWEMAAAGYQTAIATNAYAYSAHLGLGRVKSAQGDVAGARASFQTVYDGTSDLDQRARAAYSIGMILITEGNYDLARGYLMYANAFDASYASAWFGIGTVLHAQSKTTDLSTDAKERLVASSAEAMKHAVAASPITASGGVNGELISDLYVVGDRTLSLEALRAAKTQVPNDVTLDESGKTALLAGFDALIGAVEAGPPFLNN